MAVVLVNFVAEAGSSAEAEVAVEDVAVVVQVLAEAQVVVEVLVEVLSA